MDQDTHRRQCRILQRLLRQLRHERQFRQQDLASLLNKPQSFVYKYETGEKRLDFVEVRMVCRALGVPLTELMRRFEEEANRCDRTPNSSDLGKTSGPTFER